MKNIINNLNLIKKGNKQYMEINNIEQITNSTIENDLMGILTDIKDLTGIQGTYHMITNWYGEFITYNNTLTALAIRDYFNSSNTLPYDLYSIDVRIKEGKPLVQVKHSIIKKGNK